LISMGTDFCIGALTKAIAKYGVPEIMHTERGSQFTNAEFTLNTNGIAISMDSHGQWCDDVFVEQSSESINYEDVYLRSYETVSAARERIARYPAFYNTRHPHSADGANTHDMVHFNALAPSQSAAKACNKAFPRTARLRPQRGPRQRRGNPVPETFARSRSTYPLRILLKHPTPGLKSGCTPLGSRAMPKLHL